MPLESFFCSYLEVASLIQGVWGPEDGHFPIVEVRLLHKSDAEALHWLLLQRLQLHHQGLLGTRGCLVGHVNPTSDTSGKVKSRGILYSEKNSYGLNDTVRILLKFHIFHISWLLLTLHQTQSISSVCADISLSITNRGEKEAAKPE